MRKYGDFNCGLIAMTCFVSVSECVSAFLQQHNAWTVLVNHEDSLLRCLSSFLSFRMSLSALACSFSQALSLVLDSLVFALNMTCSLVWEWSTVVSIIEELSKLRHHFAKLHLYQKNCKNKFGNIFTQTNAISKRKKIEIPDWRQMKEFFKGFKMV